MTDLPSESPAAIDDPPKPRASKRVRRLPSAQDDVPQSAANRKNPQRAAAALERARLAARIADDNRGREVLLLDLRQATSLVDFFVLVSATSRRQALAIASDIDAQMKKLGEHKLGIEGAEEGRWVLIDYGDFVVHVFSEEARAYYSLEDLWGDAPPIDWADPNDPRPRESR